MKTQFSETSKGKLTSGKVVIAKSITTLAAVPALALGVLLMLGSCSGKTEKADKADADSTTVVQDTTTAGQQLTRQTTKRQRRRKKP